jgi:hypothetical protein
MGTSALVSALTALPWDNDAGFDDEPSSVGEESGSDTGSHRLSKTSVFPARPKREHPR